MPPNITVIVGAQWGDEGKGKITDYFARTNDYVVRFHGGNNAGHTLVVGEHTYKLHLLPSGILHPQCTSIIGSGVVIDPAVLIAELKKLMDTGITPRLKISERAHIIMPYHIALDEALSGHQAKLAAGSTKRGIAPVYADKVYRHGIRLIDLFEPDLFREKLAVSYNFNVNILTKVFNYDFKETQDEIFTKYSNYAETLKSYVADTELELYQAYHDGKQILFEGAQGMSLDTDHGMYPHTTSSNNLAGHIDVGSGVGFNCPQRAIGVVKAYVSRVGNSPFPTELLDATGDDIRARGQEYGTTTGRARRIGWLDLVQVRQSVRASGLTDIALTKLDILAGLNEIKVCVSYTVKGEPVTEMPASLSKMRAAEPVYETLPGWETLSPDDCNRLVELGYEHLPTNLKKYIEFIEKNTGCPVRIISLGPERSQTIVRN